VRWGELSARAEREVERVRKGLPQEVKEAAGEVPVSYWPRPTKAMRREGIEDDLMGLFVGPNRNEGWEEGGGDVLPSEILLFLDNIWEEAEGAWERFDEEVRVTYLHELGHYLGLDEDDVAERGLE
jgi:predicted Zn-dependent protease with MMP-like domain